MAIIKIEGKAAQKLIEAVSKGIGTIYKPRAIRQEADADAYKMEVEAIAKAKAILIEGEAKIELFERARERLVHQELIRQSNIEDIAEKAFNHLPEDNMVSDQSIDEDWRARFFNKAKDVSNEEIQEIWAKILAEEISNPGNISYRTLEVLSNLSRMEAEKFQIACSLSSQGQRIWKFAGKNSLDDYGLNYSDLMMLKDAGLIHDSDNLVMNFEVKPEFEFTMVSVGSGHYFVSKKGSLKFKLNQIAFTTAGREICSVSSFDFNEQYEQALVEELKATGYELNKLKVKNKK